MILEARDEDFEGLIAGETVAGHHVAAGGLESPEVLAMLRAVAVEVRREFAPAAWLIVEDNEIAGLCSITKAPRMTGVLEIGYGVAASLRGRGVATRAVADILAWACSDVRVKGIAAETSVDNPASRRVLERNGFAKTGMRTDAEDGDGELICWLRTVRS